MKKAKYIITSLVFLGLVFSLLIASVLIPDEAYTLTERRSLAQFPELSLETLSEGKFTGSFENYTLDQFPFRDRFRKLKTIFVLDIMGEKTCNDFYKVNGYIGKLEYPENKDSVDNATAVFEAVYNKYIKETDCRTYLSLIPDRNYFLAEPNGYLSIDYPEFMAGVREKMPFADYIDITPTLSIENYYFTDQHWKQETLTDTAKALLKGMEKDFCAEYEQIELEREFEGTYYGQAALNVAKDKITYLTNDVIKACKVTSYDTGMAKKTSVYPLKKAEGKDMYDIYLGGADALIVIENPKADTDKELVVFRDSFASSITPLLINSYKKITLVDFRYISKDSVGYFVNFSNQDVLFLYSTLILNNSFSFKK